MNTREFLENREYELLKEIDECHGKLAPLEAELAEVRRAKGALGIPSIVHATASLSGSGALAEAVPPPGSWQNNSQEVAAQIVINEHRRRGVAAIMTTISDTPLPLRISPYQNLTMKQLVVKVLREHFPQGATARQMLDFFRDAWGRDIERPNLSPQLSRLLSDRIIGRGDDHRWFMLNNPVTEELMRDESARDNAMDDFISDDDLLIFEGFLKYQGFDPASLTPHDLEMWRGYFDEATRARAASPEVGLMKLQPVPGEQKYAVAIRDGSDLWLTMWVRCSRKGEIFIMYPRGNRDWQSHASYHLDGTFHQKSHGRVLGTPQKRQPLTAPFKGSEHLGQYGGHGKSTGAVCDPNAFDGVVIVEPRILGPRDGSVGFDLVELGHEQQWERDMGQSFYPKGVHERQIFQRDGRPSLAITIQR